MSAQMQRSRAPWGLGWQLAGRTGPTDDLNAPSSYAPVADPMLPGMATGAGATPTVSDPYAPQRVASPTLTALGGAVRGLGAALNPRGGGVESFLSGLSNAYGGTMDATPDPEQREQQQRELGIGDALKGAQTNYYNSLAGRADTPAVEPFRRGPDGRYYRLNTDGTATPVTGMGAGTPQTFLGGDGRRYTVGPDGTATPIAGIPGKVPLINPLDAAYGRLLHQVQTERDPVTMLPAFKDPAAQAAEAQRRMAATYGRSPGFGAWQKAGGGRMAAGGGAPTDYSPDNPFVQ